MSAYTLQTPQTPIAREIYALHEHVLLIGFAISVVVFAGIVLFDRSGTAAREDTSRPSSLTTGPLTIAWTLIPVLILVAIAFPATRAVFAMKDVSHLISPSRSPATSGSGVTTT
jgi:cytochrome c oxidase subunit 2